MAAHLRTGSPLWAGESNLTAAWCSEESNLTAAWCSGESIWQQGVKSKNSERLPRPLKGQSCKKTYMWDLQYPSPLPNYNLFLTPHCMMQGGVKLQIQITLWIWNQIWKKIRMWIRALDDTFDEKNQSCKISRYCTFKACQFKNYFFGGKTQPCSVCLSQSPWGPHRRVV